MKKTSEYTEFVEKFKPKLTTDDCFTPPDIYEGVKSWVLREYGVDAQTTRIIRPFKPEGDYQAEDYSGDCVVIDNPPFSILSKIIDFYLARGVRFFLFAPHLTLFGSMNREGLTAVVTAASITYENGAVVRTSFLTNLSPEEGIRVAGDLHLLLDEIGRLSSSTRQLPKYTYPDNVITATRFDRLCMAGDRFSIPRTALSFSRGLDSQRHKGKAIFGGGFLCSDKVAQDVGNRDIEAKAKRNIKPKQKPQEWELSPRERVLIQSLH